MSAFYREKVLAVRHWTDTLFSFRATRDTGFRFQNGQFAMIGLEIEGRPLMRAYSMASANHEEELEFFSIKVADGPLTSKLQKIREGETFAVNLPVVGQLEIPRPEQLAYYGGLAALAAFELIDWPVAVVIAAGHLLASNHHNRLLEELGEAMEEA